MMGMGGKKKAIPININILVRRGIGDVGSKVIFIPLLIIIILII